MSRRAAFPSALAALAFLVLAVGSAGQGPQYQGYYTQSLYVWNGSTLMPLYSTQGIACDHWAINLYADTATPPLAAFWQFDGQGKPAGAFAWGEIDGNSAAEVADKLQRARAQVGWALGQGDNPSGYRVTLGPICVVKPAAAAVTTAPLLRRVLSLRDQIAPAYALAQQVKDAFDAVAQGSRLYASEDGPVHRYIASLLRVEQQYERLQRLVSGLNAPSLSEVNAQIADITRELAAAQATGNLLGKRLGGLVDTSWSGQQVHYDYLNEHCQSAVAIRGDQLQIVWTDTVINHTDAEQAAYEACVAHPSAIGMCPMAPMANSVYQSTALVSTAQVAAAEVTVFRDQPAVELIFKSPLSYRFVSTGGRNATSTESTDHVTIAFATRRDAGNFADYVNRKIRAEASTR